ncbi:glycosyltransferase family 8 protein [Glaciimonas sp. PCH181]|uniref:glycosyltransferase family 8 protein n=1 Tax=Glaciimonas sp. PCH181 TaxID=2133943 RepID=UPI000D3D733E|nr:glycosyltransferase [Glaciimonas sp. PCH181]PUA20276.1 hypothetical protein C7W93_11015 [Glaciimonas sp. PCH181]
MMTNTTVVDNIRPVLHVAFGVDANYFMGMGVAIVSVLENNRLQPFIFHVFIPSISTEQAEKLREIESLYSTIIEVNIIDHAIFDEFADFSTFAQYSSAIFTRLLIAGTLKGITDKVLYLDADIVCQGDLTELLSIDMDECVAAVVGDVGSIAEMQVNTMRLAGQKYFNSGMLYINVDKWVDENVWHRSVKEILASDKTFLFPDQDALNIVLDQKTKFIDARFNFIYDLFSETPTGKKIPTDAVFIHFVGRLKPWHNWCCNPANALFLKYKALSPWANADLHPPKNYKEMRMYAQGLSKIGRHKEGAIWYCKFIVNKFFP